MFGSKPTNYNAIKEAIEKLTRRKGTLITAADLQNGDLIRIGDNTSLTLVRVDGEGDNERVSTYENIWAYLIGRSIGSSGKRAGIKPEITLRRVATQADYPVPDYPHEIMTSVEPLADGTFRCQNYVRGNIGQTFTVTAEMLAQMKATNDRKWVEPGDQVRTDGTVVGEPPAETDEVTPVVFRKWPKKEGGDILALFPTMEEKEYHVLSYEHIGQHGSANFNLCIQNTKAAKPEEYADLKAELEQIGYKLKVYARGSHLLPWRNR